MKRKAAHRIATIRLRTEDDHGLNGRNGRVVGRADQVDATAALTSFCERVADANPELRGGTVYVVQVGDTLHCVHETELE